MTSMTSTYETIAKHNRDRIIETTIGDQVKLIEKFKMESIQEIDRQFQPTLKQLEKISTNFTKELDQKSTKFLKDLESLKSLEKEIPKIAQLFKEMKEDFKERRSSWTYLLVSAATVTMVKILDHLI